LNHSTQNSVARVTADFQYAYWNPISNPRT